MDHWQNYDRADHCPTDKIMYIPVQVSGTAHELICTSGYRAA